MKKEVVAFDFKIESESKRLMDSRYNLCFPGKLLVYSMEGL